MIQFVGVSISDGDQGPMVWPSCSIKRALEGGPAGSTLSLRRFLLEGVPVLARTLKRLCFVSILVGGLHDGKRQKIETRCVCVCAVIGQSIGACALNRGIAILSRFDSFVNNLLESDAFEV